jgi:hypothetical protein
MGSGRRLLSIIVGAIVAGVMFSIALAAAPLEREGSLEVRLEAVDAALVGTATVTTSSRSPLYVYRYRVRWTSSAGGAVSANPFTLTHGKLLQIKFVPDGGGTQPTDLYDVTLVDEDNLDYLGGAGADLSNATPKLIMWDPPVMNHTSQQYDVVVANAGATKSGYIYIWVQAAT